MTVSQLARVLGDSQPDQWAHLGTTPILGISTDTRSLQPGELFVALRGTHFDGHQFLRQARDKGAAGALVDPQFYANVYPSSLESWPLWSVPDTLVAYQALGQWWRQQFTGPVIGITGSVGKTTTKELIAAALATQGPVCKTVANYNNEIGVPKTLLGLSLTDRYAVIEMAMRGRGEIARLTQIAQPTIGVITNVGTAHIGRLGSEEAIAEAKCELLAEMSPDAVAILNHDNSRLMATAGRFWSGATISYGLEGGDLQGVLVDSQTLEVAEMRFQLPLPGRHNALNFMAVLAIAKVLEIPWGALQQLSVELPGGRARRYQLPQDLMILDETYNAGLESMKAAIQLLAETPGERRIAVLGTMKELGERSIEFHRQVGETVKDLGIDAVFVFADEAEGAAMAAGAQGVPAIVVEDITADNAHNILAEKLQEFCRPGDRLLLKASHSVELNRVVDLLVSQAIDN